MYHRNKVHTDEFWRHELTKNRRSMVDDKVNEDLWKKQIGKHSEETSTPARRPIKSDPCSESGDPDDHQPQLHWLEPAVTAGDTAAAAGQMSTEMKLLALQSLQNSLTLMSRGMAAPPNNNNNNNMSSDDNNNTAAMASLQRLASLNNNNNNSDSFLVNHQRPAACGRQSVKTEVGQPGGLQQPESYLALLAQLARESESQQRASSSRASHNSEQEEQQLQQPAPMLPTKEESAVKRTQLWLQQVSRYRSSRLPREEADAANHEQLWEQQIARVKRNPVKSPLEPVEIVLDDAGDAAGDLPESHRLQQHPHVRQVLPVCAFNINNNNNSATVNHNNNFNNNNNNNFVNNNNNDSLAIFQGKFLALPRTSFSSSPSATYVPSSEGSIGRDDRSMPCSPTPRRRPTYDSSPRSQTPSGVERRDPSAPPMDGDCHLGEDKSMLKSLLLDRMKRKLSSTALLDKDESSKKAAYSPLPLPPPSSSPAVAATVRPIPEAPQDILRKRLLGWVDPSPPAAPTQPPSDKAPEAPTEHGSSRRSQQSTVQAVLWPQQVSQNSGEMAPPQPPRDQPPHLFPHRVDKEEEQLGESGSKISVSYAHTSVLKHLLYRYTSMGQ